MRKMGHVISACSWDGNHKKHLLLDEHHIFGGPNRMHSEGNRAKGLALPGSSYDGNSGST